MMKMSAYFRTSYNLALYYYDAFLSTWPVSLVHKLWSVQAMGDATYDVILCIEHLNRHHKGELNVTTGDICNEISHLNYREDILSVTDELIGLNLLQHGIVLNYKDVVDCVLQRVNYSPRVTCNSATHLAAYLGHKDILKSLLDKRPYDLYKAAGLCYPSPHEPVSHVKRLGFIFQDQYPCEQKLLPIEWAIAEDHIECVKLIVDTMAGSAKLKSTLPKCLHFSACRGAEKCLKYFIELCPEEIDNVDPQGDVPLLEAVIWGRNCAKLLIDNGADVNKVAANGDTALHRLYRNDIDGIFCIYDTTQYLLTTGIEELINSINLKGETALHLLVTHISFIGGGFYHTEQQLVPRWALQEDYQEQVIGTIQLLLSFNADPAIHDSLQLQPLNKLLHVTMKASHPTDTLDCIQGSINSKYVYRNDFHSLYRAMLVLIQNGAEVNTQCAIGHSPLILLVQTLLRTEILDLVQQSEWVLKEMEILLSNGAKTNFVSEDNCTCATLLAMLAQRTFIRDANHDREMKMQYGELINNILVLFLKHGLNPNFTTTKKSQHLSGGSGNALIAFVRVTVHAFDSDDFYLIFVWLRTLLRWGADPDIESYPSDPIICHSQSSIFLKKQGTQAVSHYIHEVKEFAAVFESGRAEELLLLFYKTMDHRVLFECLATACFMARFHPLGATGHQFLAVLNGMLEKPRSLQQMARVTIYKSVNRQIQTSVDQLPLPTRLKDYLLDIE